MGRPRGRRARRAARTSRPRSTGTARRSTCSAPTSSEQGYDLRFALEPKPNEPRGDILLPTIGHALAFISELDHPELVGLNPEVGHEEMAGLNFAHGLAQALWHDKLFHVDLNGQHGPASTRTCASAPATCAAPSGPSTRCSGARHRPRATTAIVHFDYKPPRTEDDGRRLGVGPRLHAQLPDPARAGAGVPRRPRGRRGPGGGRGDELDVPTLGDGESLADLRGRAYDVDALADRSVALEALDQLAMEHLLGVALSTVDLTRRNDDDPTDHAVHRPVGRPAVRGDVAGSPPDWGYDGLEIACWGDHFDPWQAVEDDGYIQAKLDLLEKYGLQASARSPTTSRARRSATTRSTRGTRRSSPPRSGATATPRVCGSGRPRR